MAVVDTVVSVLTVLSVGVVSVLGDSVVNVDVVLLVGLISTTSTCI